MSEKHLQRQPKIRAETTPSDEDSTASPVRPVNLFGTICKIYIKDKRLLATIERRRQRALIMHKYLSSFDSFDEPPDDIEYEAHASLFDELNSAANEPISLDINIDDVQEPESHLGIDNKKKSIAELDDNFRVAVDDFSHDQVEEPEYHLEINNPTNMIEILPDFDVASDIASQTSLDTIDNNDENYFIVVSLREIGFNFINHILF
ncbi:uncharacterized protein Dmoj_GI26496, partial [Drosophila mojavensis]